MSTNQVATARAYCGPCPVSRDCLVFALMNPENWGVWGGHTAAERKRALRLAEQSINADAGRVVRPGVEQVITRIIEWFDAGDLARKVVKR